jgi:tetratricopeptide (TPR) repeat protein
MTDELTKSTDPTPTVSPVPSDKGKAEETSPASSLPQSPEDAQAWLEKSERFVKLVAENLRYGSWSKRFVTIGGVAFLAFNPISAGKVAEFFGVKELPKWYVTAFWTGMGGMAVGSVGAAIVTLPKRTLEPVPERQAIKGLRSFEQKDAEIFKRLERGRDVQDCLDALDTEDLRLFLLMGESGVGKSSLLQAGLMPNLGQVGLGAVYVKLGDRDPIVLIRKALGAREEPFVEMLQSAVEKAGKPIVLILDQFEQFFVQFQEAERSRFIGALKEWYDSAVPVKILIGIRGDLSDRLVEIQKALGYSLRPSQVHRLEKFAPEQATEVLRVMAETEKWSFNEAFVQEMARDELAGLDGKVAPVEVQVLAQMVSREPDEENRRFDKLAFQRLGGVDGLLGRSLQRSLDAIPVKSERERALEVLLALTDLERNVRSGSFSIEQLQQMTEKVHGSPSEVAVAVAWLAESRLITPGEGEGNVVYELAHERLIPALRQVANQELTDANRANLLLDRRVNEWLGSGKSRRYLFSARELWLLRQQRGFLEWGQKQAQKRELLRRSWWKAWRNLAIVSTPISFGIGFWVWSNTPEGQVQWARWNLIEADRLVDLERGNEEVFMALTLDALDSSQAPFPLFQYFGWDGLSVKSMREPMVRSAQKFGEMKDQSQARQLLGQLLALSTMNRKSSARVAALSSIAEAYIKLGDKEKAKQLLSQALDTAQSIHDDSDKAYALSSIAKAYIKLGDKEKSKELLSQAIDTAKSMQEDYPKTSTLGSIAEASTKLGDKEKAKQLLSELLDTARLMKNDYRKADALSPIAEAYIKLGDKEKAKQLLSQPLDTARLMKNDYRKAGTLRMIAEAYIKLGDKEKAKQLLSQVLDTAQSMQDTSNKAEDLRMIARTYIKLGDKEKSKQVLFQALDIFKSTQDYSATYLMPFGSVSDEAYTIRSISQEYSKFGDIERSKQLLFQALNMTKSIQDKSDRAYVLSSIAEFYTKLGDKEKGKEILFQSLNTSKSTQEDSSKAKALSLIAETYLKLNDHSQAKTILIDATKSAEAAQDSRALRTVAQLHADLGNQGEALRLAQRCNGEDKVNVLARIIRVHAEQKHPEFKVLREKKEEGEE